MHSALYFVENAQTTAVCRIIYSIAAKSQKRHGFKGPEGTKVIQGLLEKFPKIIACASINANSSVYGTVLGIPSLIIGAGIWKWAIRYLFVLQLSACNNIQMTYECNRSLCFSSIRKGNNLLTRPCMCRKVFPMRKLLIKTFPGEGSRNLEENNRKMMIQIVNETNDH